ncbi:uncharacterized protein LOC108464810 [Gossypium arboreum]|uniref:uncharacterized protein LOC108464810 n=1 Tax=Gossypium arboreum TaxID=29729 RepID=UPI0022F15454|nr:uncharacterized protein LOC108464810 [Gossypium arboreum]
MTSSSFSPAAPPVFNGEGYHIWVVKMRTYLQAFDLWEVVNSDVEPEPLRANPTVAQMKQYSEEKSKKHKAMSCIQNCFSDAIFTRIMACKIPKQAWDKLKEEFQGTERTRQQQLLNLRKEFENLKMKEEESVKKYSDRIMVVVNSIRLIGEQFDEARIVEKVLSTLPERYEAKISSLEDSRDLTSISLTELINALYAQQQRRASRSEEHQEDGAGSYPPCPNCKRVSHPGKVYWFRPDVQYRFCKKMGHVEKVENGHFIKVEGKGDVLINTPIGTKLVTNVLLVPEIDRNLLSIAQLLEKGYSVVFKGKECLISDPSGSKLMTVAMTEKSFIVDWNKSPDSALQITADKSKSGHKKLSHANYMSMAQLTKEDLVENLLIQLRKKGNF